MGWRYRSAVLLLYVIQLALVATTGMQVYQVMEASLGQSLALQKLKHGFDYTVFADFLKVHGASITPLLGQLRWLVLLWIIVSVFLHGGLLWLAIVRPERQIMAEFWTQASRLFWANLRIGLFFMLIGLLVIGLCLFPTLMRFETLISEHDSEIYFVRLIQLGVLVAALLLMVLFVWSVHTRIVYIKWQYDGVWAAIKGGLVRTVRMWRRNLFVVLIATGALVGAAWIYRICTDWIGSETSLAILSVFVMQQLFMLFRVFWRFGVYVGLNKA